MKKTIYTLNLNPKQYRPITDITYPWLKVYAHKIGAKIVEIKTRKFPQWQTTYEKLQVYELGQKHKNDWNIFMDCDSLIHPDTPDFSAHLNKDTVAHNGADMASFRWRYDKYFWRDGRNIGSATWNCWASDWCIDLFRPIEDMTPEETYRNIFPILNEVKSGVKPERLVEDYVMSRNIARFGLKFTTLQEILTKLNCLGSDLFFHLYAIPIDEKVVKLNDCIRRWGLK